MGQSEPRSKSDPEDGCAQEIPSQCNRSEALLQKKFVDSKILSAEFQAKGGLIKY